MTRKAAFLLFISAGIVIIVLAALFLINRNEAGGQYRVGLMMPLTGGAASLGTSCRNGVLLAVEQYNATKAGLEPEIELLIEDTKADPSTAVSAFHKLTSADGVRVIIGPLASGPTLAIAPLTERTHTVILSPGASAPSVSHAGDFVFRNELSETYGAREQATLAFEQLGFRKIALLYVNNEYGAGTAKVFRERFSGLGGTITSDEAFNPGTTDFRTALTVIRSSNPDAIFFVYQDDIVNFIRQRAELGVNITVYTTPVFETQTNLQALGELAEGVIYASYGEYDPAAETGLAASFNSDYRARFNGPPSYYSAQGYDAARIIIEVARRSEFNLGKLKDDLYRVHKFAGVTGMASFDQNGDVQKPVILHTVHGGHFVKY